MASYNVYLDSKNYSSTYDMAVESIPLNTAFSYRQGELCFNLDDDKNVGYGIVISNLGSNNITPLDKHIIGLVASFGYMTTKQISEALALIGINKPAEKLLNNTERLRKNGILRAFSFGMSKEEICKMHVFSLNKNGSEIAKVIGVNHNYNTMNAAAYPFDVKKVLVRNQGVLAFLKSGLPLDWFKINTVISSDDVSDAVVRPSFTVSVENEVLMYEVVRTGQFWENTLRDKLSRYKQLFDHFGENNWGLTALPTLVMVGENSVHCMEIKKIAEEIGLEVLFTNDLMFCGRNFYHSVYKISDNGQKEHFMFDLKKTKVQAEA